MRGRWYSEHDPSFHLNFSVSSILYAQTDKMEIRDVGGKELCCNIVATWRWSFLTLDRIFVASEAGQYMAMSLGGQYGKVHTCTRLLSTNTGPVMRQNQCVLYPVKTEVKSESSSLPNFNRASKLLLLDILLQKATIYTHTGDKKDRELLPFSLEWDVVVAGLLHFHTVWQEGYSVRFLFPSTSSPSNVSPCLQLRFVQASGDKWFHIVRSFHRFILIINRSKFDLSELQTPVPLTLCWFIHSTHLL